MKNKKFLLIVFVLMLVLTLTGCANEAYMENPLGDGFGFWDIFVYPMAGIMWCVGKTIGFGNYALTIIFSTLIVRTIAWPIYAKTNDMQLKMKLVQPEVNKLQAKYANKTDQESQRRMQMEMMNIYKKEIAGVVEEWIKSGFSEDEIKVLGDILYLTKTLRKRLIPIVK